MARVRWDRWAIAAVLVVAACSGGDDDSGSSESAGEPADELDATPDAGEATDTAGSDSTVDEPAAPPIRPPATDIEFDELAVPIPEPEPADVILDEEETEVVLLPADLLAQVEAGVEAGSFTEVEGLVRALGSIGGFTATTPGMSPDDVTEYTATPLLRTAGDLLEAGDLTDDERAQLEAALAFFNPTQDVLDAISRPAAGPTGFRGPLVQNAAVRTDVGTASVPVGGCPDLESWGFDSNLDTGPDCYLYEEADAAGNRMRVYYPSTWQGDDQRRSLIDSTLDAMVTSILVYKDLATVGDVNAVFSVTQTGTAYASQLYFPPSEPCPVTIFPTASDPGGAAYKQTIAHEVFHCVQDWSFTSAPYSTHKWWLEGSATYFSNVVYPATNFEHRWTGNFDVSSRNKDLTQMSYHNTVFFQYYANVEGVPATITLLDTVSAAGASVDAIASVPGMADLWQDFVVVFIADKVFDPGGGTVGRGTAITEVFEVDSTQTLEFETQKMVATRYLLKHKERKHYEQMTDDAVSYAVAEVQYRDDLDRWTRMPVDVRPTCDDPMKFVVVPTTVEDDNKLTTQVTKADQAVCDPCLLGTWGMRAFTFSDYIKELLRQNGGMPPGINFEVIGSYKFTFDADGNLNTARDLTIIATSAAGSFPTNVSGNESGRYDADGDSMSITGLGGSATGTAGGVSVDVFNDPNGGSTAYTCEDEVLTMTSLPYGELVFDLIEPPPEPPPVIIEAGSAST